MEGCVGLWCSLLGDVEGECLFPVSVVRPFSRTYSSKKGDTHETQVHDIYRDMEVCSGVWLDPHAVLSWVGPGWGSVRCLVASRLHWWW